MRPPVRDASTFFPVRGCLLYREDGRECVVFEKNNEEADFVAATRYPHIQAWVVLRKDLSDMGFIGRNEKTGETVIKSVYHVETKKIDKK